MQLKSQLEYEIVTGHLRPGSKVPSVRKLARALQVSPATVTRAYQELQKAALVVSHPGSGLFVLSTDESQTGPHGQLRAFATAYVEEAMREGISLDQALQIVIAEIAEMRVRSAHVELVVICKRDGRRDELAMHLRHSLLDYQVEVTAASLEDVEADIEGWLPRLRKARHVLCLAFDLKQAHAVLAPHGITVMPILGTLRADTQERLLHLPAGTKVGVLASLAEFVDGMISAVLGLNPTVALVGALSCEDADQIPQLLASVDCLVHSTLARRALEAYRPLVTDSVELIYVPEDCWTERFRRLVQSEIGV